MESFYAEVLIVLLAFIIVVYNLWTSNNDYWKKRGIYYLKPNFPFGNTKDLMLMKRFNGHVFADLYFQMKGKKFGGIFNMRRPMILLRDPEMIKQIMTKDFNYFTDRGTTIDEKQDPLLVHLFHLRGERWRSLRVKLTPTFTSGKMKLMFHLMKACGMELQKSVSLHAENEDVIEVKDVMARFGTDVIGSCAFGLDIDSLNNPENEFRRISREIFKQSLPIFFRNFLNQIIPGLSKSFRIKTMPKEREDFFLKVVRDTVEYREKNKVVRNDFLDLLIQIRNKENLDENTKHYDKSDNSQLNEGRNQLYKNEPNGDKPGLNSRNDMCFTNELMTAQCFVFFIAGFETSSTTQSFCLYELALNKNIQQKLQQEIDTVLEKHNNDVSYEALKEMTYMDMVIQETLRKYPPLSSLGRECVTDYQWEEANLLVEKGTRFVVPLYGLHYDPEYYPNPERFDPERFTAEAKQTRHNYTWLPFGEGPRNCIGLRFGLLQVKTALTMLLSKYSFDRVPQTQVPLILSNRAFLTSPAEGIKIKITKRISSGNTSMQL